MDKKNILRIQASILFLVLFILTRNALCQIDSLKTKIGDISHISKGKVGIALKCLEDGETLYLREKEHFPMQSVVKFPLAMNILSLVDSGKLSLDQKIHIRKKDLLEDTWSPLREKFPKGNIDITVVELLEYSVSQSDNNAADILFRLVGGPRKVQSYLRKIGITGINVAANEAQLHDSWDAQFLCWCEPVKMIELLEVFYKRKFLSASSSDLLLKLMTKSENSPKRIRGLLPPETIVAHKTGTSNTNDAGVNGATNDVGIITLPNGKHLAIVVYVSMSTLNYEAREALIAQIAKAAWDYYSK